MKQALGLVEIEGLSTAITVADAMVKAANVTITELENTKGLGYMTIKVIGDVGAVNAAVNVGSQMGTMNGKLVSCKVIARPSDYVDAFFVNIKDGEKPEVVAEPEVVIEPEVVSEPEVIVEPEPKDTKTQQKKGKTTSEGVKPEKKDS